MALKHFKPKPGRFGVAPVFVAGKQLDGAAAITASATVAVPIGTPFRKCYVEKAGISLATLPIGNAAITATLRKKPAGTAVSLSAAIDLTTATQTVQVVGVVPILSTATDAQRTLLEGEFLYWDITAAGTVSTQPIGFIGVVELLVLE